MKHSLIYAEIRPVRRPYNKPVRVNYRLIYNHSRNNSRAGYDARLEADPFLKSG